MRLPALPFLVALVLALCGLASAAEHGAPTHARIVLVFTSLTNATLDVDQEWDAAPAAALRQSLDAYFGNGDGFLTPREIANITSAAEHDATGPSKIVGFDGGRASATEVTVQLNGTDASNATALRILHHATLTLAPGAGDHTVTLGSPWGASYNVTAPPGFTFAGGATVATGMIPPGSNVTLSLTKEPLPSTPTAVSPTSVEASPNATPNATSPTESIAKPPQIPGLGAVGTTGILALGALGMAAWSRRKEKR